RPANCPEFGLAAPRQITSCHWNWCPLPLSEWANLLWGNVLVFFAAKELLWLTYAAHWFRCRSYIPADLPGWLAPSQTASRWVAHRSRPAVPHPLRFHFHPQSVGSQVFETQSVLWHSL